MRKPVAFDHHIDGEGAQIPEFRVPGGDGHWYSEDDERDQAIGILVNQRSTVPLTNLE